MKYQYWSISLISVLLGAVIGYGMTPDKPAQPLIHSDNLEQHLIELDAKIENIEAAVHDLASNVTFSALQSTSVTGSDDNGQQVTIQKDDNIINRAAKPVKQTKIMNSALAPVTAEEQVAINRLIQNIGDQNLKSHAVIGSDNMQAMSLAAQNQVMAEITRRLNSGELRSEDFFGPEYPMH